MKKLLFSLVLLFSSQVIAAPKVGKILCYSTNYQYWAYLTKLGDFEVSSVGEYEYEAQYELKTYMGESMYPFVFTQGKLFIEDVTMTFVPSAGDYAKNLRFTIYKDELEESVLEFGVFKQDFVCELK